MENFQNFEHKNNSENITNILSEPTRRFFDDDQTLRLHKAIFSLQNTIISFDNDTAISRCRRPREANESQEIVIGTKAYPPDVAKRFNMLSTSNAEEVVVKIAHEAAHAFQFETGLENNLVNYLHGQSFHENALPYIKLYMFINQMGRINTLTNESIYKLQDEQREHNHPKIVILEDITELISTYLISDEYFLKRLDLSMVNLSPEARDTIAYLVIEICQDFDK